MIFFSFFLRVWVGVNGSLVRKVWCLCVMVILLFRLLTWNEWILILYSATYLCERDESGQMHPRTGILIIEAWQFDLELVYLKLLK